MLTHERREIILEQVLALGRVQASELATSLGVSEITIRRDLNSLHSRGALRRVHGGAVRSTSSVRAATTRATVGVVVPVGNYYFSEVINGASSMADTLDVRLVLGISRVGDLERNAVRRMLAMEIDGLLVTPPIPDGETAEVAEWLADIPVPVVLMERSFGYAEVGREFDIVRTDHAHGAFLALQHLHSLGHDSISVVLQPTSTAFWLRRGAVRAAELLGIADAVSIHDSPSDAGDDVSAALTALLDEALAKGTRAFFVHNDIQASQFVDIVIERGLRVPEDVAVVTYDDVVASMAAVPLTAVTPPKRAVGATALDLLSHRIRELPGDAAPVTHTSLLPTLTIRASSATEGSAAAASSQ